MWKNSKIYNFHNVADFVDIEFIFLTSMIHFMTSMSIFSGFNFLQIKKYFPIHTSRYIFGMFSMIVVFTVYSY